MKALVRVLFALPLSISSAVAAESSTANPSAVNPFAATATATSSKGSKTSASPKPGDPDVVESDALWIWSPAQTKNHIPVGDCYFRKTFNAEDIEAVQIHLTADNRFELFVNGQSVVQGADWRQMQIRDVTKLIHPGRNVVAVRASNTDVGAAGLVARVLIKHKDGTYEAQSSDKSWKTTLRKFDDWHQPQFNDRDWVAAASFGAINEALPWGNEIVVAGEGARFTLDSEFEIERLMRDSEVGSLIAMTFDARGNIIASQEGGHLVYIADSDNDGVVDRASVYCDKINTAQGLLALGSRLFVIGEGPEGPGLYRLRDADRDGQADEIKKLMSFRGSHGEHGPHGLCLGPDGLIYVVVGNFARADMAPAARSPYRKWYEGDLVQPKYPDAGGHEVGIPAPGGTVFRTDADGSFVEFVAGGLRNAYDLAFSPAGELFTYDSDMEWDIGAPWYRPTRVNHVIPGAEMGWRAGWSKWPEYYLDSLPAAIDVGLGSPTGMEFYDHVALPEKYRGALFACDWATGRIHAFTFQRKGATYVGKNEIFLRGQPLNATDIAVAPDGALYFCTGGRGTDGGVYRIRWNNAPDIRTVAPGDGVDRALRQPQLSADWGRARIAAVKQSLGAEWGQQLNNAAEDAERPLAERLRAIDLMVCFGPRPTEDLLQRLAIDRAPEVRAKAAQAAFTVDGPAIGVMLTALLEDSDPLVRRTACESLGRQRELPEASAVIPLLADEDRFVAFAARRLLEQLPIETWADDVLAESNTQGFCFGAVALANLKHDPETCKAIIDRCQELLQAGDVSAATQLDLLRVTQLALIHGKLGPQEAPQIGDYLLEIYPTKNRMVNRELARLLVHLQVDGAATKFAAELKKNIPIEEKMHIAAYSARLKRGWSASSKLELLNFYEEARKIEGGYSVDKYFENFSQDFLARLSISEKRHLVTRGDQWPATALSVLAGLSGDVDPELLADIRKLDVRVAPRCPESNAYRRLRVGIIAVLGAAADEESQDYLHAVYQREPEYRDPVAMSLTQRPEGANWSYLIDVLKTADEPAAQEVMTALAKVPQRPKEAPAYRNTILLGLRLGEHGAAEAIELLKHWNGDESASSSTESASTPRNWKTELSRWQAWYAQKFPDAPPAELPADEGQDKWSYDELLTYLESDAGKRGNATHGAAVFASAQCTACHRFAGGGETFGPDLSDVGHRFQRKELLESIVYPSHDVSDQYASRMVLANGKTYAGLVRAQGETGVMVLLSNGRQVQLTRAEIEDIQPSDVSVMPQGLLNSLSLEQVSDLFAYLTDVKAAPLATRPRQTPK